MNKSALSVLQYVAEGKRETALEKAEREKRRVFAKLVSSELGYGRLLAQYASKMEEVQFEFDEALRQAGVRPFTKESVERYKVKQSAAANRLGNILVFVVVMAFLAGGCAVVWYLIGGLNFLFGSPLTLQLRWAGGILAGSLVVPCFCAFVSRVFAIDIEEFEWKTCSLQEYEGDVPECALQYALAIKKQLPAATFEVEALVGRPDPFLIVRHRELSAHIYVWGEPEYEAEKV